MKIYRHKKRNARYYLIGIGKMQSDHWVDVDRETAVDMREVAIYRSIDTGSLWVRPIEEFNDGRFEEFTA